MPALRHAADLLASARRVVVLTGAGVSAESGIPTFRDAHASMGALWSRFDPQQLATPQAFDADPALVTEWYDVRRRACLAAQPNPAHTALATLESHVLERAGSRNTVELHGNITTWRCTRTANQLQRTEPGSFPQYPLPSPFHDRALLRPAVVWFGESLPASATQAAHDAVTALQPGDVFLTVGTSALVYPAAGYIQQAKHTGATTIEINKDPTPVSDLVDLAFHDSAATVLPQLLL